MKRGLVAMVVACCAMPALGQNALGDGTNLDASPEHGASRRNSAARNDLLNSYRLRNAIVTGNAPGGVSFRGDVGYTAPNEFRGDLASDDLFTFRRDSLYSGIAGLGLRGTDALQYQFALTTGSRPPADIAGSLSISRNAYRPEIAVEPNRVDTGRVGSGQVSISRVDPALQADQTGAGLWRVRSSAGYLTDKSLAQSFAGQIDAGEGTMLNVTASPLRGLSVYDPAAATNQDPLASRPANSLGVDTAITTASPDLSAAQKDKPSTGYDQIMSQLRVNYDSQTDTQSTPEGKSTADLIEEQNQLLSSYLQGVLDSARLQAAEQAQQDDQPTDPDELTARDRLLKDLTDMNVDPKLIESLRRGGLVVDDLVDTPNPAARDFYAIHMQRGKKAMQQGSYFDAEARFSMALSLRPGDPTAAISRAHAQIGAGLFVSAAVNLRETLTTHPAMIGSHYASGLIPSSFRLRQIAPRLAQLAHGPGAKARQAALVLAYIGYQLDDKDMIAEGLDRLDIEGADRLAGLLRLVWLDEQPLSPDGPTDGPTDGDSDDTNGDG